MSNLYDLVVSCGKNNFSEKIMYSITYSDITKKLLQEDLEKSLLLAFAEWLKKGSFTKMDKFDNVMAVAKQLKSYIEYFFGKKVDICEKFTKDDVIIVVDLQTKYLSYSGISLVADNFNAYWRKGDVWSWRNTNSSKKLYSGNDSFKYFCLLYLKNNFVIDEDILKEVKNAS